MSFSTQILATMSGERTGPGAGLLRAGLWCASVGYRGVVGVRNGMFDAGLRSAASLGRPVISVGNITTGGTGKTPMVGELARRLLQMGHRPTVLLRGYGRRADGAAESDEESLYRAIPGLTVVADSCRRRGAATALSSSQAVSVFLLDDGFQHRQAHRDADIVLIDATNPFGFGHLLPRGLMREPASGLRRADAVIVTRADQVSRERLREVEQLVARHAGRPPIATAAHVWSGFVDSNGKELPIEALRDRKVAGVCAIGNPQSFRVMLTHHARSVAFVDEFVDHHAFTTADVFAVMERATRESAEALVMTEKDWVKWRGVIASTAPARVGAQAPLVLRPRLEIRFLTGGDGVDAMLRRVVARPMV